MDFELSEDQRALAAGLRALLGGRFSLERVRRAENRRPVVDPDDWAALGEAGVFSMTVAEADGGVGLGMADAAVVFEELGRALVPGPLVGSFLAAGLLEGVADGLIAAGVAERPEPGGPAVLPLLVEHLASVDALLVLPAPGSAGATAALLRPDQLAGEALVQPLDPLTPLWRLPGGLPPGEAVGDPALAARLRRDGTLLTAALQVGGAAACVERAVAHAKDRRQFGRPVGGFQAVKHLCADMLVRAEVARCAVHAAAVLADQPDVAEAEAEAAGAQAPAVVARAVAGAKLLADEAAIGNARTCIQVHGGMGFTWEVPVHLYLKRARLRATTFGTPDTQALAVADHV